MAKIAGYFANGQPYVIPTSYDAGHRHTVAIPRRLLNLDGFGQVAADGANYKPLFVAGGAALGAYAAMTGALGGWWGEEPNVLFGASLGALVGWSIGGMAS